MPRVSGKQRALRELEQVIQQRDEAAIVRLLFDDDDSVDDDIDDMYRAELERVKSLR